MRALLAIGGVVLVLAGCASANAQDATKACNTECLLQKIDMLEHRVEALQRTVDDMTTQINKTIKSGQNVTLHTQNGKPGGCLTYFGPSGDKGGRVSWNVDCNADALWTIN